MIHAGCKGTSKKYRHRSNPVAVIILDKAGWHTTGKLDIPDKYHPVAVAATQPGPGRKCLAIFATKPAVKPRL